MAGSLERRVKARGSRRGADGPFLRRSEAAEHPAVGGRPIAAVTRAMQVLAAFRGAPRLNLSELSRRTGLFKSTLLRILATLELHGFVIRLVEGHYQLGGIVYELGAGYAASFRLEELVVPALERLSAATGESAAFYVGLGPRRQCLFRVDSPQTVRAVVVQGQILDLDGAATSQLLRRYATQGERPRVSDSYEKLCLATSGIGDPQTASVAAPVFGIDGLVGVMNVSGPVHRFTAASVLRFRAELARAAARISSALGGLAAARALRPARAARPARA